MRSLIAMICAVFTLAGCASPGATSDTCAKPLRISWSDNNLVIRGDRIPGGKLEVWYLEAYCRTGSTDRDWKQTVIPHKTRVIAADRDQRHIQLECVIDGGNAVVRHEIKAGVDEVDFRLHIENKTDEHLDIDWVQPCMRVGEFTGRGQDDYFERCFIFTEKA